MGSPWTFLRLAYLALFLSLAGAIIFIHLLPLGSGVGRLPGPDFLVALAFAWVLRRPEFAPVLAVAAIVFLSDVFFMRPLGLWTALVVIATEALRRQSGALRDQPFLAEWALVAGVTAVLFLANTCVLALFGVEQPGLGLVLLQMIFTVVVYPIVTAVSGLVFGVTKPRPRDSEGI
ncbi:MAG: rod shape-determining protein MreD [Pseudomonadota bacterium]